MVRSLKQELSEAERYAVADDVIWQLKKHGDPWRLNEAEGERADDLSRVELAVRRSLAVRYAHTIFRPQGLGRAANPSPRKAPPPGQKPN